MLRIGEAAPSFELLDDQGEAVTLEGLLTDGPFVLYFYPADFTPICTRQACMFRDEHPRIARAGLRVFGVSPQSAGSHAEFRQRHHLPFTLLADPDRQCIEAFRVSGPFGIGVRRATFLIDGRGRVADREVAEVRVGRHRAFAERITRRTHA